MKPLVVAPAALFVAITSMCLGGGPVDVSPAEGRWTANDLPGASDQWSTLEAENPEAPEVLVGRAYDRALAGDWDGADALLARAQEASGDADGAIKLRRALVALQAGERLDQVKRYALESGRPEGKLLAAEVQLADASPDEAILLLKEIRGEPGPVGETAENYLRLLESTNVIETSLGEMTALWAVGMRDVACQQADVVLPELPDSPDKASLLLLWAGRAVTSGRPQIATTLLDTVDALGVPPEQQWRVGATRALVAVATDDVATATALLDALQLAATEGAAPWEGVMDARATAAALATRPADARTLGGESESAAVARGLYQANATARAKELVPPGTPLASFLENR
jgi:hypothetical protein